MKQNFKIGDKVVRVRGGGTDFIYTVISAPFHIKPHWWSVRSVEMIFIKYGYSRKVRTSHLIKLGEVED